MHLATIFILSMNILTSLAEPKNSYGQIVDALYNTANTELKRQNTTTKYYETHGNVINNWISGDWNNADLLASFMEASGVNQKDVSQECKDEVMTLLRHDKGGLVKKMLDAMGKPSSGVLVGNVFAVGDYDECLSIKGKVNNGSQVVDIKGRYCVNQLRTAISPLIASLWGWCVPSGCTSQDVIFLLNSTIAHRTKAVTLVGVSCNKDSIPLTTEAIACIVVLSVFGVMLLIGTLYDLFQHTPFWKYEAPSPASIDDPINNSSGLIKSDEYTPLLNPNGYDTRMDTPSNLHKVLMAFSVYNNTKKLFNTKVSPHMIKGLDGFRALSLSWVILGHSFAFIIGFIRNPLTVIQTLPNRINAQPLLNSFYSVDSFFFMSGLLVTYHFLNYLKSDPSRLRSARTWIMYYVHRYLRLTPFYMIILMIYLCLSQYWSEGPFHTEHPADYKFCQEKWWTNVLYINNFFDLTKVCFGWSWYLSNDMQFHIISPLIIVPLFLKPVFGAVIIACFFIMTVVYRGVMSAQYELPFGEVLWTSNLTDFAKSIANTNWETYYVRPWYRIAPYLVGMIIGYALYKSRRPKRLPKVVIMISWLLCVVTLFCLLYGSYNEAAYTRNSNGVDAFFNSINKTLWGLVIGWVIYATNVGCGGIAGEFLSWRGWTPIARLTYAAYLIHPIIMTYYFENMRVPIYFTIYHVVYMFFGFWVMTYFFSYLASMAFEAPLMMLEKIILPR